MINRNFTKLFLMAALVTAIAAPARADLDDDLVAYWPFDGNLADAVGEHHGEAVGTDPIAFEDAQFGQGIRLNGEDQYVEVTGGDESDFDFAGGSMSISAWFTVDAFDTSWQALIAKGESDRWRLHRRGDEAGLAFTGGDAGDTATGVAVDDGEWHHVVAIAEAGQNARLYIDGQLSAESGVSTLGNNDAFVRIGDNPDAPSREWEGFIDDVAIWGRALTELEIATIWDGGTGADIGSLLGVAPPQLGDFNGDGAVDTADYMIMTTNFHKQDASISDGDVTLDGVVDINDFAQFRSIFEAQPAGASAVPEPGAALLLALGLPLLGLRRGRRGRQSP